MAVLTSMQQRFMLWLQIHVQNFRPFLNGNAIKFPNNAITVYPTI